MVHPSQRTAQNAAKEPSWRLTYRRGETMRTYRVRPALIGLAVSFLLLFTTAYVGATAYLFFRDDLIGTAVSRQVKLQYSYEERIAALRAELDRMTSRHAVQTLGVEEQLQTLLAQQEAIERRQASLDTLVEQARAAGIDVAKDVETADAGSSVAPLGYASTAGTGDVIARTLFKNKDAKAESSVRPVLVRVGQSIDRTERLQRQALDSLHAAAAGEAERLSGVLAPLDANVGGPTGETGPEGGPYLPPRGLHFVESAALLKNTLAEVTALRADAAALPLGEPVEALYTSSRFGNREDPFLKRVAFHAGIDLVAAKGTIVRATAPGTVTFAGTNGGYGEMIEIQHANGIVTRYGHLSAIAVRKGMHVEAGTAIGAVGSTGRSTGPHLHYETRVNDEPVNPAPYLAAGEQLRSGS